MDFSRAYRGIEVKTKEFVYGDAIGKGVIMEDVSEYKYKHNTVMPETVSRNTFRVDKNSAPIYAGDKVVISMSREPCIILDLGDHFNVQEGFTSNPWNLSNILSMDIEVVGNIYQHPEPPNPCPFCGAIPSIYCGMDDKRFTFLCSNDDPSQTERHRFQVISNSKTDAIRQWNQRQ